MPRGVGGQITNQFVALGSARAGGGGVSDAGVYLVDDHQVWAGTQELVAAAGTLDEVSGHDGDRIALKDRLGADESSLQAAYRAGQHQFGFEAELSTQFALPLLGQRRAAQHGQPAGIADFQ